MEIKGLVKYPRRTFSFITVGTILDELNALGLYLDRKTFYRHEQNGLFTLGKTLGGWRRCTRKQAEKIKKMLWINYIGDIPYPNPRDTIKGGYSSNEKS